MNKKEKESREDRFTDHGYMREIKPEDMSPELKAKLAELDREHAEARKRRLANEKK